MPHKLLRPQQNKQLAVPCDQKHIKTGSHSRVLVCKVNLMLILQIAKLTKTMGVWRPGQKKSGPARVLTMNTQLLWVLSA